MDSWVTLDSWVIPYSILVLDIQNMMKEMSFYNTVGSSEFYNAVHAPNASYMSGQLAIR